MAVQIRYIYGREILLSAFRAVFGKDISMSIFDLFKKTENEGKSAPVSYIVAGLGNPGTKYEKTRHNAGFLAIDHIAEKLGVKINSLKFQSLICRTAIDGTGVLLMKPQTFMNASGIAIDEAASFYKIPPEHIIILCDDIAQQTGHIRIRKSGSAGGHNGLKSVIGFCGSEFPRIRMGVGEKPNPEYDLADWVTGKLPEADMKALQGRFDDVYDALRLILRGDYDRAMNLYNR